MNASPIGTPRLVRELIAANGPEPLAAARWLRGEPRAVALSGAWAGGGAMLASHPVTIAAPGDDPFALLDAQPRVVHSGPAIGGGWLGWLGFGLARTLEPVPPAPPRPEPLPLFDLAFHDHLVRRDANGRWWFEALWTDERADVLTARLETWRARMTSPPPPGRRYAVGELRAAPPGTAGHAAAVAEAIERIAAGEIFQANVCLRLEASLDGDLLDLWTQAAAEARAPYAAYVASAGHAVASISPELFLRRRGREVVTQPIKGTAPRETDPAALARSDKDRAENVMIVDLMRNDLGRVCAYGTVEVSGLFDVRPAAGVWHLVSTVRGRLREDAGDGDLLRATFPPGSVVGAPKVRALRVISELEATGREAYCGAIGYCSPVAGLELNVAIRTFETRAGRLWFGAGGGVMSDSSPEGETVEALAKAAGAARAARVRLDAPTFAARVASPLPAEVVRRARPDPAAGVFDTVRVTGGRCVAATAHMARLRCSCDELGLRVPAGLADSLANAARRLRDGGVRIVVTAGGTTLTPVGRPSVVATALRPVVLPGGLGAHKWADRNLIDAFSSDDATPLFVDLDGQVLEAGYAAALLVEGDVLVAPPLDGRVLPSISRKRALSAARGTGFETCVEPFTLERARSADAILLTSALRGPHPGLLPGGPDATVAWRTRDRLASTHGVTPSPT